MTESDANAFCLQLLLLKMVLATGATWQPSNPREHRDLPSHNIRAQDAVWEARKIVLCNESGWDPAVALTVFGGVPEGTRS